MGKNKKSDHKDNIKNILNDEIKGTIGKCFTGMMIRIVNVLCGYYDDINIGITENEQIRIIISKMMHEKK